MGVIGKSRQAELLNRAYIDPARILEIEVTQPLPDVCLYDEVTTKRYSRLLSLIRLHARPLGVVEIRASGQVLTGAELASAIWQALATSIIDHFEGDGMPFGERLGPGGFAHHETPACHHEREQLLAHAPAVSVVIPTRDRPEALRRSLTALNGLRYPEFEVIVVDNAASSDASANLVRSWQAPYRLRYAPEPRQGVSWARNRGLTLAEGEYVAFIDDDVTPDPDWLTELVLGFSAGDRVVCVTGLILPRELETPAQIWFEQFGRLRKGFDRRLFDLAENRPVDPLYPYVVGCFGAGANFGFRTASLRELGGFDPVLGTGTPAMGGEDIEICFRTIRRGFQITYQPSSLVYHSHQRDYSELRRRAYTYGVGLTAFLTKLIVTQPARVAEMGQRLPFALNHVLNPHSPKNRAKGNNYPTELSRLEVLGMLHGPFAYLQSRRKLATAEWRSGSTFVTEVRNP